LLFKVEKNFNVKEVVEAIRTFVFNFFSCQECSQNFRKETEDYERYLSKPYDAIYYIWKGKIFPIAKENYFITKKFFLTFSVHNKVNKRLAITSTHNDPQHPKILFPTKKQCPACYLPGINAETLSEHESPFQIKEVLLFLTSFYSKYHIEPIKSDKSRNSKPDNKNLEAAGRVKPNEPDVLIDQGNSNNSDKNNDQINKILENRRRNLDLLLIEENYSQNQGEKRKTSDLKLGIYFILFVIGSFGFLHIYVRYVRPMKGKEKKHIV
jgi:hypothetical protein